MNRRIWIAASSLAIVGVLLGACGGNNKEPSGTSENSTDPCAQQATNWQNQCNNMANCLSANTCTGCDTCGCCCQTENSCASAQLAYATCLCNNAEQAPPGSNLPKCGSSPPGNYCLACGGSSSSGGSGSSSGTGTKDIAPGDLQLQNNTMGGCKSY
jgi:hypothetical protein